MKPIRWTDHALRSLADREIERDEVDEALAKPDSIVTDLPGRRILMRRYFDHTLGQQMLLRIVVEDTDYDTVVITVYKTSQISRYFRG